MIRTSAVLLLAFAAALAAARSPLLGEEVGPSADLITSLPGFNGSFPAAQFSGYLTVDATNGRYLHYWAALSESDPANDPVVLWMNGGPGCSSLDGYFYEQGPLHFVNPEQGTGIPDLKLNPTRWNMNATVVFLEAPAGVGFSYSETASDYSTNDNKTAADNLLALEQLFTVKFPSLAANDFYISGESYAGIYVPTLAYAVHQYNKGSPSTPINLKGIMVGNGCLGNEVGACSAQGTAIGVEFLFGTGLYSAALHSQILSTCQDLASPSEACEELLEQMSQEIGRINVYDVYGECIEGGSDRSLEERRKHQRGPRVPPRAIDRYLSPESADGPVGCIDGIAAGQYLNHPSVREAIHVKSAAEIGEWTICTNKIFYQSNVADETQIIYPTLLKNYRVLIFNGDVDACVPYVGNEHWTSSLAERLGLSTSAGYHAWYTESEFGKQVGGYATNYEVSSEGGAFSFITVHGSGHMVPEFQPEKALAMFNRFMSNQAF